MREFELTWPADGHSGYTDFADVYLKITAICDRIQRIINVFKAGRFAKPFLSLLGKPQRFAESAYFPNL